MKEQNSYNPDNRRSLIVNILDNPRFFGAVSSVVLLSAWFLFLQKLNTSPSVPDFLHWRIKDTFGTMGTSAFFSAISKDGGLGGKSIKNRGIKAGLAGLAVQGILESTEQVLGLAVGSPDTDFGQTILAYGVGALMWIGVDNAWRKLRQENKVRTLQ